MLVLRQHCARMVEEGASSVGQLNAARLAAKKLNIEFAFDRFDALAERRLLNAQPFGGARDMSFVCNYNEIAEVSQLHFPYPLSYGF
jgi:hypothetical protein